MANGRLSKSFATTRVEQLKGVLSPTDYARLVTVLRLVDETDAHANVKAIHDTLWPAIKGKDRSVEAMNKALKRFFERVDEAALAADIDLQMGITEARKGGAEQRFVWFEGDAFSDIEAPPSNPKSTIELHGIPAVALEPKLGVERGPFGRLIVKVFGVSSAEHEPVADDLLQRLAAGFASSKQLDIQVSPTLVPPERERVQTALFEADFGLMLGLDPRMIASDELPDWTTGHGRGMPGKRLVPIALRQADMKLLQGRTPDDWLVAATLRPTQGKPFEERTANKRQEFCRELQARLHALLSIWVEESEASRAEHEKLEQKHADREHQFAIAYGIEVVSHQASDRSFDLHPKINVLEHLEQWVRGPASPSLFALLGEYGMGKTVSCERLVRRINQLRQAGETQLPLPVYLDLRSVTGLRSNQRRPRLLEIVEACLNGQPRTAASENALAQELLRCARSENVLFIFDGLDEALVQLDEADGQAFTRELLRLLPGAEAPSPRVLIACRTHYFRTLSAQRAQFMSQDRGRLRPADYRALELVPFDRGQVREYFSRALPGPAQVDEALDLVESVRGLSELTRRPYTLSLVVELMLPSLLKARGARTIRSVDLYREVVERWLERDNGKHHLRAEHKIRLMMHLAALYWRSGRSAMAIGELEQAFHAWLSEQPDLKAQYAEVGREKLEEDLRTATFLVRERAVTQQRTAASSGSEFCFAHRSVQEFFLALHLFEAVAADRQQDWAGLQNASRETLQFFAELLTDRGAERLLQTLHRWVAKCRPDVAELLLSYCVAASAQGWPVFSLRGLQLERANLSDRVFCGTSATPLVLSGCRFIHCDLRGARFEHATMLGAHFEGSDLRESSFRNVTLHDAQFVATKMDKTEWASVQATNAKLNFESCSGARFRKCAWPGATISIASTPHHVELIHVAGPLPEHAGEGVLVAPLTAAAAHKLGTRKLVTTLGHSGSTHDVQFSPDASHLVSVSGDGTLKYWDAQSGVLLATWTGHHAGVITLAFSRDGRRVVSASSDGTLKLWDRASGVCLGTFVGHHQPVSGCAFSPDDLRVISVAYDGDIRIWLTETQACEATWQAHEGGVHACALSPDGRSLVSVGSPKRPDRNQAHVCFTRRDARVGEIKRWDLASQKCLNMWPATAFDCAFSPDGRRVFSVGDGAVKVWDVELGSCVDTWPPHPSAHHCNVSADGAYVSTTSFDGTLKVWNAATGQSEDKRGPTRTWTLETGEHSAGSGDFSRDGTRVATVGMSGGVTLWDAATGERNFRLPGHNAFNASCAFSDDGAWVAASFDESIAVWNAHNGSLLKLWAAGSARSINACAFLRDGESVISGATEGLIDVWNARSGDRKLGWQGAEGAIVTAVTISPDGARVAACGFSHAIEIRDVSTGSLVRTLEGHASDPTDSAFSPDGQRLVSVDFAGQVKVWDAKRGTALSSWQMQSTQQIYTLSYDAASVLATHKDGTIERWDIESRKRSACYRGHLAEVTACTLSRDGKLLVSTSDDRTIKLWDASSGEHIRTWPTAETTVLECTFSPDASQIACIGADGLRLLDVTTGRVLRRHQVAQGEHATWDPEANRVIEVSEGAWRWLGWQILDERGRVIDVLPLEAF